MDFTHQNIKEFVCFKISHGHLGDFFMPMGKSNGINSRVSSFWNISPLSQLAGNQKYITKKYAMNFKVFAATA